MPFRRKIGLPQSHYQAQRIKEKLSSFSPIKKWRIVKGDRVMIIGGPDKGRVGIVKKVVRPKNSVTVAGLNLTKVTLQPSRMRSGHYEMRESLIHRSDVALVDPLTQKPTRISMEKLDDGTKVRVAKSRAVIPKPDSILNSLKKVRGFNYSSDTPADLAKAVTYVEPDWKVLRQFFDQKMVERAERIERDAKDREERYKKKDKSVRLSTLTFDYVKASKLVGQQASRLKELEQKHQIPAGHVYLFKY